MDRRRALLDSGDKILYIYKEGFTEFKNATIVTNELQSLTFNSDHFAAKAKTSTTYYRLGLAADFTKYKKLIFEAKSSASSGNYCAVGYALNSVSGSMEQAGGGYLRTKTRTRLEMDISSITGVRYIIIQVTKNQTVSVYDIHFE